MYTPLHPDRVVPALATTWTRPRPVEVARPVGPSTAQILVGLAWLWCLALCARVPLGVATTGLAAAYGLLFMMLLPFNRWACFLVLVAACATEDALRAWSPIRYNTLHYLTFLFLPVAYVLVRPRASLPKPMLFWLCLCLWFAASLFWIKSPGHWMTWVTEYFGVAGLAMLTRQLATSPRRRRELALVFALTALAFIVAMLGVFGVGSGARLGDVEGMNPNGVGRLAAMGMLMLAVSSAEAGKRGILNPRNVALLLALGVGLMLTQSRGSILAVAGAALMIALGQPRLPQRVIGVALCGLLGAGLVGASIQLDPEAMQKRWRSTVGKKDLSGATAGRSEIARTAVHLLRDNWIAGVGAGQFSVAYREYSTLAGSRYNNNQEAQAHSAYLKIPSEGGIVAALLLVGFYLALWIGASRLPPGQRRAVARAIVVYILLDLVSGEGIEKEKWLAIGLLLVWFWENSHLRRLPSMYRRSASAGT